MPCCSLFNPDRSTLFFLSFPLISYPYQCMPTINRALYRIYPRLYPASIRPMQPLLCQRPLPKPTSVNTQQLANNETSVNNKAQQLHPNRGHRSTPLLRGNPDMRHSHEQAAQTANPTPLPQPTPTSRRQTTQSNQKGIRTANKGKLTGKEEGQTQNNRPVQHAPVCDEYKEPAINSGAPKTTINDVA